MKLLISEEQYKSIFLEQEETPDPEPKSGASDDQSTGGEGYPDVSTWEDVVGSKLQRGAANQIKNTKWSDVVGSQLNRDAANQLNEDEITELEQLDEQLINGVNPLLPFLATHPKTAEKITNAVDWITDIDNAQSLMDWAGLIPFIGDAIDLVNATIYFGRSIYNNKFYPYAVDGMLSLIGVIPIVGSTISIPIKTLFKKIGKTGVERIVKLLSKADGKAAAEMFVEMAKKIPGGEQLLKDIAEKIAKEGTNLDDFFSLFEKGISNSVPKKGKWGAFLLKNTLMKKALSVVDNIGKGFKGFFEGILEKMGMKETSALNIPKIGSEVLTKTGRLDLMKKTYSGIGKLKKFLPKMGAKGQRRIFLATQDMFGEYLSKEGKDLVDAPIVRQAFKNLGLGKIPPGKTIEGFIEETPKLKQEIVNLTILNKPQEFEKFLSTSTFRNRFDIWAKTIKDPTIYKDITTFKSALKTLVGKGITVAAKSQTTTRNQDDQRLEKLKKRNAAVSSNSSDGSPTTPSTGTGVTGSNQLAQPKVTYKYSSSFPFTVGQKNSIIKNVQKAFNLPQTGNYDNTLKNTLLKNGYDVTNGLTWDTYKKINIDYLKKGESWQKI